MQITLTKCDNVTASHPARGQSKASYQEENWFESAKD